MSNNNEQSICCENCRRSLSLVGAVRGLFSAGMLTLACAACGGVFGFGFAVSQDIYHAYKKNLTEEKTKEEEPRRPDFITAENEKRSTINNARGKLNYPRYEVVKQSDAQRTVEF